MSRSPRPPLLTPLADDVIMSILPAFALGDEPQAPRRRPSAAIYGAIEVAMFLAVSAAGLLCPWGVARFYQALAFVFVVIAAPTLLAAALLTRVCERSPTRIQGVRRRPALMLRGARDTTLAAWIAACLAAWPLSRAWAGLPIGLVWTLPSLGAAVLAVVQTVLGVLVLDAWLYWKHRLLHTRLLFPFHRTHHTYRDPTCYTSFAVGPVESLLTFWPVLIVAIPAATHWAPLYFPMIVGFIGLNLYLHCGATSRVLEALLPRLRFNTSAFHNVHHANAEVHFAEALTIWDQICRTTLADRRAARSG